MALFKTPLISVSCRRSRSILSFMIQRSASSFKAAELSVELTARPNAKPDDITKCQFGKQFTDHMLSIEWNAKHGWGRPNIKPLQNFHFHPATSVFHYATALFEGMKAYRTVDNQISLFRPMKNMKRMQESARRAALPDFDKHEFLKCIAELVKIDQEWVPYSMDGSLYLRPTFIGTEPSLGVNVPGSALLYCILSPVGPYFDTGTFQPVSLMADPSYIRAFPGGVGSYKLACNYAPTIRIQQEALKRGCQQVLWLYGEDHKITEVGTMNLFVYWINENGEKELATMPLTEGIVLPGVTRDSLLHLAREWNQFKVSERIITMNDVTKALQEDRLLEMFGAGTACVVCPVDRILYQDEDLSIPTMQNGPDLAKKFYDVLTAIQYGKIQSDWNHIVVEDTELGKAELRG